VALSQPRDDDGMAVYRLRLDPEGKEVIEAMLGPLSAPRPTPGCPDLRTSDQRRLKPSWRSAAGLPQPGAAPRPRPRPPCSSPSALRIYRPAARPGPRCRLGWGPDTCADRVETRVA
jgi:hypothetical protein